MDAPQRVKEHNQRFKIMRLMTLLGFILTAIVLIADAITGVVGVIATVKKWVIGEPTPTVRLNVKTVNDGGDTCLEFVFFDLPESFQLDHVRLDVVGTAKVEKIPPMAGVQYSMTNTSGTFQSTLAQSLWVMDVDSLWIVGKESSMRPRICPGCPRGCRNTVMASLLARR